jgi:hypothetical protein
MLGITVIAVATGYVCGQPKPPSAIKIPSVVKPTSDPLRAVMEKQGYTAIRLIQVGQAGPFFVECKSGDESWLMKLDTTTEVSCLDERLAKKLGLSLGEQVFASNNSSVIKAHLVSLNKFSIGDFNFRKFNLSYDLIAIEYSHSIKYGPEQKEARQVNGILGQNTLQQLSAVIDYSTLTLYLQPPLRRLWPKIEGKWVAESIEKEGNKRIVDPQSPPILEFKNDHIHVTDGAKKIEFAFHTLSFEHGYQKTGHGYQITMYDPTKELAKELEYDTGGILKIEDDVLTICFCLDPKDFKGMPDDFTAPSKSGLIVLKCRREKSK